MIGNGCWATGIYAPDRIGWQSPYEQQATVDGGA